MLSELCRVGTIETREQSPVFGFPAQTCQSQNLQGYLTTLGQTAHRPIEIDLRAGKWPKNRLIGHLNPDRLLFTPLPRQKMRFRSGFLSSFIPMNSELLPQMLG